MTFDTQSASGAPDCIAPDGSEIRFLAYTARASSVHCTLGAGQTSLAVQHKTIDEIWYYLTGRGEVWRKLGDSSEVLEVEAGISLSIPVGTHFQFRNVSDEALTFVITTMPPLPGDSEAIRVADHWRTANSQTP